VALEVTAEAKETPISVQECMIGHLRATGSDDDEYVKALIKAATNRTEIETGRALVTRTLRLTLDQFPCGRVIELPRPPLIGNVTVKYLDTSGAQVTLSSTNYTVDARSKPGRIILNSSYSWPSVQRNGNAVEIQYDAGYGAAAAVPEDLKHAIKFLVGLWYRNREPSDSIDNKPVPLTYEWLVGPYRY